MKILNTTLSTVILLIATLLPVSGAMAHTSGGITVKDAWVREAPPNAPVMAGYLTVENHTAKQKVIKQATSSSFATVEMHRTEHHKDMARMVKQNEVMVPAEGEVKFSPGGLHLMLITPKKSFRSGDTISLTLTFSDGSTSIISAKVKKAEGGMDHSHHHDMHGSDHMNHDSMNHDKHNDMNGHADHGSEHMGMDKPEQEHDHHHSH